MHIPKKISENRTYDMRANGFDRQPKVALGAHKPGEPPTVPRAAIINEDGSIDVTMMAIGAKTVEAGIEVGRTSDWIELKDDGRGLWTGTFYGQEPGFKRLVFRINGVQVLNPLAPAGFGDNRTINFIDIPNPDWDWILMKDVPHGSLNTEFFKSSVTGEWEDAIIYTPPGYQKDPNKKYPVLYLLHGGGDNETAWNYQAKVNFIMDNLIAEGKAVPCIIVMTNGSPQVQKDGEWFLRDDLLDDVIIKDIMPFMEDTYRILTGKEHTGVAGLSMGSLQAARIGMSNPELFSYLGMFTGFLGRKGTSQPVQPYLSVMDDPESFNRNFKVFFFAMGDLEPGFAKVAEQEQICRERGLNYVSKVYHGQHEWNVWREAIHDFLPLIFRE